MTKLSDREMIDLCNLSAERCLESAFDVLQLVDDPKQRMQIALNATKMLMTLTLAFELNKMNDHEMTYEKLVDGFAASLAKMMKAHPPPEHMLKRRRKNS